jgi:pyrroline-5-carboxylate reductase
VNHEKITFIGAGSMAEAIVAGLIKDRWDTRKMVMKNREDRERLTGLQNKYGITPAQALKSAVEDADIIILAVKPKDAKDAVSALQPFIKEEQLIISVMAGISTLSITEWIKNDNPVIRAMPNTSAAIGHSATAVSKGQFASGEHVATAIKLFETIGTVTVVAEEMLHTVTGLSGSGPAYLYYMAEAMEKAAQDLSLPDDEAKDLIAQTLLGAALMLKNTDESPASLRKKVTSPAGTTEAGISMLEQYNVQEAIVECIKKAAARSVELGTLSSG